MLGTNALHTYDCGPRRHIGLAVLGAPVKTYSFPILFNGCVSVDWRSYVLLGAVAPPTGTFPLGIPNVAALTGVEVNTQVWWVNLATVLPIEGHERRPPRPR